MSYLFSLHEKPVFKLKKMWFYPKLCAIFFGMVQFGLEFQRNPLTVYKDGRHNKSDAKISGLSRDGGLQNRS